jgi:hypothetical protein
MALAEVVDEVAGPDRVGSVVAAVEVVSAGDWATELVDGPAAVGAGALVHAVAAIATTDKASRQPRRLRAVRRADVVLEIVGIWMNLVDP